MPLQSPRAILASMGTPDFCKHWPRAAAVPALLLALGAWLLPAAARAEPGAKALEALTKAFAAQDAKDWDGAKTLVQKQPVVVRDLVQWRFVSSSESGASFDEIDAFLNGHANWPGRSQIVQRGEDALLANALMETKGPGWFKARQPRSGAACLAWAKWQFAHEQKAEALTGIRRCWLGLTLSFADYQDSMTASQMGLSETDHLARADALLWNRNVTGAREMLPLLSAKAQGVVGARANIQSGGDVDVDDVAEDAPSPAWAASLSFDQSVRLRKAGRNEDAWSTLLDADKAGAPAPAYSQAWWAEHNLQARAALDADEADTAYKLAGYGDR